MDFSLGIAGYRGLDRDFLPRESFVSNLNGQPHASAHAANEKTATFISFDRRGPWREVHRRLSNANAVSLAIGLGRELFDRNRDPGRGLAAQVDKPSMDSLLRSKAEFDLR